MIAFFSPVPSCPLHCLQNIWEWGLWCSALGDTALFDPLTTYGNILWQRWIPPAALVQILWETWIILSIQFCGSVEELRAAQWGISHLPLPLATLLIAMHSHHLSWAASGYHQTCPSAATDLPDSRKQKQWQPWLALCCLSVLNWLMEKSEECQSWHKGEWETWVVRREARERGRQGQPRGRKTMTLLNASPCHFSCVAKGTSDAFILLPLHWQGWGVLVLKRIMEEERSKVRPEKGKALC